MGRYWLIVAVFLLGAFSRIYWVGEKDGLHGDEQTSLVLAYNAPGWGERSYEEGRIYTGEELRRNLYVDEEGGFSGYKEDIASLWRGNRDLSHASLYYMLLRTALIGIDFPDLELVIGRGFGLNLLLFAGSFLFLSLLLLRLFPKKTALVAGCLLLAYLNPLSVSNTLLLREYQLAECLFMAFCWLVIELQIRMERGERLMTFRYIGVSSLIIAFFLSAGYFNAIFVAMAGGLLFFKQLRYAGKRELFFIPLVAVLSVALCVCMYRDFFAFLSDVRMQEVREKAGGSDSWQNLRNSIAAGGRMLLFKMWGPALCGWFVFTLCVAWLRKRRVKRISGHGFFILPVVWFVVVLALSTWKMTRYVAPCVPVLMAASAYYVCTVSCAAGVRRFLWIPVCVIVGYLFWGGRIEYLEKTVGQFEWPAGAKRLMLYATYADDRNTLSLLAPYLTDGQECLIVADVADIQTCADSRDAVVYVFADKTGMEVLHHAAGYRETIPFNTWQNVYLFRNLEVGLAG